MPGPVHLVRLLALAVFLVLVALGLWLLDVRPALVIVGMVVALAIAWTIEWLAWSGLPVSTRAESFANEPPPPAPAAPPTHAVAPEAPRPAEAAPAPTFVPPAAEEAPPAKASREPEPEPEPEPARRRRFFARRSGASGVPAGDEPVPRRTPAEPVRSPSPAPPPATPPRDEPEPSAEPDRRELIRSVPAPPPEPPPPEPSPPAAAESPVVAIRAQAPSGPRQWNLWDLERLAREEARRDPSRRDEWSFLILHLRRFASADGLLPSEFDPLVRESFDGLLEGTQRT